MIFFIWFCLVTSCVAQAPTPLPPTVFKLGGCLYAFMNDGGQYKITFSDGTEPQTGLLSKPIYDSKASSCITKDQPGSLVVNFDINDNFFQSMALEMQLRNVEKEFIWEVSSATLKIVARNQAPYPDKQVTLRPANGAEIYADMKHSYSCSSLVLTHSTPNGPHFTITLKRFQLQPFPESNSTVFAASRDCSTWLTLPQIMGFLLILFMIFTVLIGVYLLLELGNHSGELRFSKQGGMLMNQAQLDATKAD